VKALIYELRLYISERLIAFAFDVMPDGPEKEEFCDHLLNWIGPVLSRGRS
jgi:hypothetical protein